MRRKGICSKPGKQIAVQVWHHMAIIHMPRLMMELVSQEKIMQVLDWAYERSVNGFSALDSAEELAASYAKEEGSAYDQANSLIRWQNTKSATSGFITGLGGLITLPVALPANITSVLFVQIRMIAAIAHLGGYDVKDDKVKALVFACLTANSAKELLKDIGIVVGNKLAMNAVKSISGKTLIEINKKVGFKLFTKFGEKGVINLGKAVPLLGGLIGGSFDAYTTNAIGNVARDTFTPKEVASA
ncbi:EcsC family protein [Pseudomonas sp. GM84]|uniref:EcsC family protein n=1 Tax=Pseudomonas sp. GM84 TaxID=1144340 RepID=UPI000A30D009|nr:EcsC family protein [Pseudomonas sp. GM84]